MRLVLHTIPKNEESVYYIYLYLLQLLSNLTQL